MSVLQLAALKGVFTDVVSEQVTFVNAPLLAKDRGVDVGLATYAESRGLPQPGQRPRRAGRPARPVSVSGTLTGPQQEQKLTEVTGYDVDLRLEGHLLFFRYTDRPGVVGTVGARLGDAGVNIDGSAGQPDPSRRRGPDVGDRGQRGSRGDVLAAIGTAIGATDVRGADIDTDVDDRRPGLHRCPGRVG